MSRGRIGTDNETDGAPWSREAFGCTQHRRQAIGILGDHDDPRPGFDALLSTKKKARCAADVGKQRTEQRMAAECRHPRQRDDVPRAACKAHFRNVIDSVAVGLGMTNFDAMPAARHVDDASISLR